MDNLTQDQMRAELEKLRAINAELKEKALKEKASVGSIKVSAKGAVSVYGFGRWPVTLYRDQWIKLFEKTEEIKEFIKTNESLLSVKE